MYPGYPQNPGVLNHLLYKVVIAKLVYCILQPQYELIIYHSWRLHGAKTTIHYRNMAVPRLRFEVEGPKI